MIRAVYAIGIAGVRSVGTHYDTRQLTHAFAHTLVPIGVAYVLAHYFSLLIWQSQAMVYLASDPLGNGANMFGTSGYEIDYHVISYAAIWYVQVAALLSGHVSRPRARARPRPGHVSRSRGSRAQPVLDARRDGGLHELRAVAAVLGGDLRRLRRSPAGPFATVSLLVLRRLTLALIGVLSLLPPAAAGGQGATGGNLSSESGNPINDQGSNYQYRSNITSITPNVRGLDIQVLEFADRLLLTNHTGQTVTIFGYQGEPYARVLANGTAEQNVRSPATYLDTSFYGNVKVPASASPSAVAGLGGGRPDRAVRMA